MPESTERGALTEAVFYVLLALHTPMHGYGIMQFVKEITVERVQLGPGTLYGAINTLLEKGWIRALRATDSSRKKEYEITPTGHQIMLDEVTRLQQLLDHSKTIRGGIK